MKSIFKPALTLAWLLGVVLTPQSQAQTGASADVAGKVMTVTGPIDPALLGHTLMHEHVFIDARLPDETNERWVLAGRTRPLHATQVQLYHAPLTLDIVGHITLGRENRDNLLLEDEQSAINEVAEFRRYGGGTLVELTGIGQQRSPAKLRRVAQATGVNIVMGAGWAAEAWHPTELAELSIEALIQALVRDLSEGVEGTDVRAGIIGSIVTRGAPLTDNEIKIIKASARASRLTGAAISLAPSASPQAQREQLQVLDLLAAEGADLRRVIVGGADPWVADKTFLQQLLKRGVMLQFDLLGRPTTVTRGRPTDTAVARMIVELLKAGHADQILLSQSVSTKVQLKAYGGYGYSFIQEYFLSFLQQEGASAAQIEAMMVKNPQRILTLAAPKQALTNRS